jgi:hypothetical protein
LAPGPITGEFLLSKGTNLQHNGKWCKDLKSEVDCGETNYVPASGLFKKCGFKSGSCSTKHGHLVCPIPVIAPPPSASAASPSPPPFSPGPITCEFLLFKGTNLQDAGMWCKDLKTEEDCGEMNYVPAYGLFKQCGFKSGSCSTKYGDLSYLVPQPP